MTFSLKRFYKRTKCALFGHAWVATYGGKKVKVSTCLCCSLRKVVSNSNGLISYERW